MSHKFVFELNKDRSCVCLHWRTYDRFHDKHDSAVHVAILLEDASKAVYQVNRLTLL